MHALVKHPLVNSDVEEAAFWYGQRNPAVAVRFVDEARDAMFAAAKNPLHFIVCFEDVRRVRLRRFPHSVFFQVGGRAVLILAVLHGAREVERLVLGRKSNG
jgi:plasmid stabilization system protein ParE